MPFIWESLIWKRSCKSKGRKGNWLILKQTLSYFIFFIVKIDFSGTRRSRHSGTKWLFVLPGVYVKNKLKKLDRLLDGRIDLAGKS